MSVKHAPILKSRLTCRTDFYINLLTERIGECVDDSTFKVLSRRLPPSHDQMRSISDDDYYMSIIGLSVRNDIRFMI